MSNSPDLTMAALKMLFSLFVVLAIIWGLYRVAKRSLPAAAQGSGKGKSMKIIESQHLGLKKNITMVQIPGSVLVLGISAEHVNLLTKIDDPDIIQGLVSNVHAPRSVLNFKQHLRRFSGFKSRQQLSADTFEIVGSRNEIQ